MTFRLRSDADVDAFLAADRSVQTEVAYQCTGLLRRTLARDGDRWLVLQIWSSPDACADGERVFRSSRQGRSFLGLVEPHTIAVDRFAGLD